MRVMNRFGRSLALYLGAAGLAVGHAGVATLTDWPLDDGAGAVITFVALLLLALAGLALHRQPAGDAAGADRSGRLIDDLGEVVFATDTAGQLVRWNRPWWEVTGQVSGNAQAGRLADWIHPAERGVHHEQFGAIVSGAATARRYEARLLGRNGEARWMALRLHARRDPAGYLIGVAGIMVDIHSRKLAEQALMARDRSLTALLEHLPGMAFRCRNDRHWTMEFVSEGCFELTGREAIDLISQRSYADLMDPDDRDRIWAEVQRRIARHEVCHLRYRIRLPDGSPKWVEERSRGIFASDGTLLAIEGFITDTAYAEASWNSPCSTSTTR